MTLILGLRLAQARLEHLDIVPAVDDALKAAAQALEDQVVATLSQSPGQDHSAPWLRTGQLCQSIGHSIEDTNAFVGSTSDVAVDQELGTSTVPPRPFLASTAAATADDIVAMIAERLSSHLADL